MAHPVTRLLELGSEALLGAEYVACAALGMLVSPAPIEGPGPTVVLVGGLFSRGVFWWRLRADLRDAGFAVHVFEHGFGIGCARRKAAELEAFLAERELADVIVVAHSLGGWITAAMGEAGRSRVRRLIAVATPWGGSRLANWLPLTRASAQLRVGSRFLADHADPAARLAVTAVVPTFDTLIHPAAHLRLAGADEELELDVWGHLVVVQSRAGRRLVVEACERAADAIPSSQ